MINFGVGAEVAATIQDGAFLRLEAPVKRVAGWSTHTGLMYEKFIIPDVASEYLPLITEYARLTFNRDI
jgi:2-oxoisovalerate dehydrogenase E1 component beta subunit